MVKTREHTRLKIRGAKIDCNGGIYRYDFRIDPIVHDGKPFLFYRYCLECDLHDDECRKILARDLRKKHSEAWQRYHVWKENRA